MTTTADWDQIERAADEPDASELDAAATPPAADDVDDQLVDDDGDDPAGEVTLPGNYADCLHAGRAFTVRLTNRERVMWERTARKHGWGEAADSPHEALTFMAWSAARRDGDPAGSLTFDQFVDQVEDIAGRAVKADRVRPTR